MGLGWLGKTAMHQLQVQAREIEGTMVAAGRITLHTQVEGFRAVMARISTRHNGEKQCKRPERTTAYTLSVKLDTLKAHGASARRF